ncbi:MAG: hypothetical protein ACYDHT_00215 [Solirubrobacteraceae bacterium]
MAKLMREAKLRERRLDKQAKKEARKLAPPESFDEAGDAILPTGDEAAELGVEPSVLERVSHAPSRD